MAPLAVSPRLRVRLDHYSRSHSKLGNISLHSVGIPCLVIAVLGLIAKLGLTVESDWLVAPPFGAGILVVGAGLWYAWLDWRVSVVTSVGAVICLGIGVVLALPILAALAAVGIVAHMIGHFGFEGKAPSTLSDPMSILDAPIWLVSVLTGMYKIGVPAMVKASKSQAA